MCFIYWDFVLSSYIFKADLLVKIDYEMNGFVDYTNVDYTLSYQHRACYSANADARTCFRGKSQHDIRV